MSKKSRDEALAHFGVKGMRWGVRNESSTTSNTSKNRISTKKKVAISLGVLATGAAITAVVLNKKGDLPVRDISRNSEGKLWDTEVLNG